MGNTNGRKCPALCAGVWATVGPNGFRPPTAVQPVCNRPDLFCILQLLVCQQNKGETVTLKQFHELMNEFLKKLPPHDKSWALESIHEEMDRQKASTYALLQTVYGLDDPLVL